MAGHMRGDFNVCIMCIILSIVVIYLFLGTLISVSSRSNHQGVLVVCVLVSFCDTQMGFVSGTDQYIHCRHLKCLVIQNLKKKTEILLKLRSQIFWDVVLYWLINSDVLKECSASIFRIRQSKKG
jgi:hypothetical protein